MTPSEALVIWRDIFCDAQVFRPSTTNLPTTVPTSTSSVSSDSSYCCPIKTGRGYKCNSCDYSVGPHCYDALAQEETGEARQKRQKTTTTTSCKGRRHKASQLTEVTKDYFKINMLEDEVKCGICSSVISWVEMKEV